MKNIVGRPLDELEPFIGEWTVEGRHVAFPDVTIRGHSLFEWWGNRVYLLHHSSFDHPDFPDSLSVIGATGPDGGLALHWFDTRGVHRVFDMTFAGGVWTISRKAAGPKDFDQDMRATFSADGNTMTSESRLRDPGTHDMKRDFAVTYVRAPQRAR